MHTKTANEAVMKIRGPAGTLVILDIFSTALGTKKQVTLIRQHLEIPIIQESIKKETLIIQLFSFNDHSRDDVLAVMKKNAGKYKNIILDLRNNGGGTLQSAVDVGSLFLKKGQLIATVDGVEGMSYISHGASDYSEPLYLLVNGQTASAAEILTAALNTHLKAPIF
jgi:carboxyl-terminal processing protease